MSELRKDILYYIMVDYDGTVCFQNKISFKNKRAIKKAQKLGYKFILNTGRSRGNLPKDALTIDWDYIVCGANYIEKKGEIIFHDEIPYPSLVQAFRVAKNVGSSIEFEGEKSTILCKKEEIKNLDEKKFNAICGEIKARIKENPITKVDLWRGIDNRIDSKLQDYQIIHHDNYVELFKKGTTKGTIALKLMEIENIKKEELIGIGDSVNDFDLLNVCSYKVAMKLSPNELQEFCDEVTVKSSTGVGDFVNKLIKLRK
ncbi:MAG: HAD-IIB family hydrolase [Bacilli bacterium]